MGFYAVMVTGSGIRLALDDGYIAIGFFTTRYVAAQNGELAVMAMLDNLRKEWASGALGDVDEAGVPELAVESCDRIGFLKWLRRPSGYTFYPAR
ncbi:hypothetical protein [Dyella sp. 2RAB6]|uniref:hypothetical protein n=1 Tax=Dyella sp. 2RAB6 TaxID=3232992 RepID=UPI003F928204